MAVNEQPRKPDSSPLTTDAPERSHRAERDYLDSELEVLGERIAGSDRAVKVWHDELTRVPTDLDREVSHLRELTFERISAQQREAEIQEAHRLELKSDAEKALLTAREADQKAVQAALAAAEKALLTAREADQKAVTAALAAAEKARDQQVIASQLATSKSEETAKDQQNQQGATFTLAIANLTTGLNDLKGLMGEMRAEQHGAALQVDTKRARESDARATFSTVLLAGGFLVSILAVILANFFM